MFLGEVQGVKRLKFKLHENLHCAVIILLDFTVYCTNIVI